MLSLFGCERDIVFPVHSLVLCGGHTTTGDQNGINYDLKSDEPLARWARNSLLDVLKSDYIRVARAKGLKERMVIVGHGFRNALLPLVTIISLSLPALFNGTLLVESLYAWPGIGGLYLTSVARRDYPVVIAIGFISSLLVLFSNLLADVAYGLVDPRIAYD